MGWSYSTSWYSGYSPRSSAANLRFRGCGEVCLVCGSGLWRQLLGPPGRRPCDRRLCRPFRAAQGTHRHLLDCDSRHGGHCAVPSVCHARHRCAGNCCCRARSAGLAAGGEIGPSSAFVMEAVPASRRGYFVSCQLAGNGLAPLLGALVGVGFSCPLNARRSGRRWDAGLRSGEIHSARRRTFGERRV
jgi:hypothetical protein